MYHQLMKGDLLGLLIELASSLHAEMCKGVVMVALKDKVALRVRVWRVVLPTVLLPRGEAVSSKRRESKGWKSKYTFNTSSTQVDKSFK